MKEDFQELWRYRELLWTFVLRELRIRYKNSVLGFFWSLLNPLAIVLVMTVVFKFVMGQKVPNYSAYILSAYLPFMFFQLSLMDASQSILAHLELLKKIYFPREILPVGAVLANFIHFSLAMGVFFAYLLVVWMLNPGDPPFRITALFLPALMLIQLCLTLGLALFVSALNTFYEDVKYILSVGLYLLFFLCPIVYFSEQVLHASAVPEEVRPLVYTLYHLNPIAMLMTAYRKILLDPQPIPSFGGSEPRLLPSLPLDGGLLFISVLASLACLISGYAFFNKKKWKFVERP
ncbi:MAG: ABC transporter permease [Fimbriimonadales bacterium]|nr:ABC transporter permease [Fimbriimonadales bacterium]